MALASDKRWQIDAADRVVLAAQSDSQGRDSVDQLDISSFDGLQVASRTIKTDERA